MRRSAHVAATATAAATLLLLSSATAAQASSDGSAATDTGVSEEYVVLYTPGTSSSAALDAIADAGGTVVRSDAEVGFALVTSTSSQFVEAAAAQPELDGAAHNKPIAYQPQEDRSDEAAAELERLQSEREATRTTTDDATVSTQGGGSGGNGHGGGHGSQPELEAEPLADLQWDMEMIGATVDGTYATQPGDDGVTVAVIDTGVDGTHPDIAANFDASGSRNFVTDIPVDPTGAEVDGPCEYTGCVDPVDHDDNGHGTHVAGTIGASLNGLGMAGVAPEVTLVNLRAGQDSGYFFLEPALQALVYAGKSGVDVANMSFYIDPWLLNCGTENPALDPVTGEPVDTLEQQIEQQIIVEATQRAADYARSRGVTLVVSAGNGHTDLDNPVSDSSSPDYPADAAYDRLVNSSCKVVPGQLDGIVTVTSVGPSGRKAYYSDYGVQHADIAAPGGDYYDPTYGVRNVQNLILAPYPANVAQASGDLNEDGTPNTPFVIQDCDADGTCAYYQYLQGTSMAAPHAAGVAALVVSEYGEKDRRHRGELTLSASTTTRILYRTATDTACPVPATVDYAPLSDVYDATCVGSATDNGFYGTGVIDAEAVVAPRGRH